MKMEAATKTREPQVFKLLPSETVMDDDAIVGLDYVYIVDGVFKRQSNYYEITIGEWKRRDGIKEVRRCNLLGHPGAFLGDRVTVTGEG